MSVSKLPAQYERHIQEGHDPVVFFRELVQIPCVTFNEYLMYDYLLGVLARMRSELSYIQQDRLEVGFTKANQLKISWRGRPSDKRRTVLVAHVDQEGFLVKRFIDSQSSAICWHAAWTETEAQGELERDKIGSPVRLLSNHGVMSGTIVDMWRTGRAVSPADPFDHEVLVGIKSKLSTGGAHILNNKYFEGIGHYEIPAWHHSDGVISATHVDNVAGVSVLMSVLMAMVKNNWRVNADVLFTSCEEAGFCGVVSEILNASIFSSEKRDEVICIVVDSSSRAFFLENFELWDHKDDEPAGDVSLEYPVIRTGDARTMYDSEVSKLLCTAASNLQRSSGKPDQIPWAKGKRISISEDQRSSLRTIGQGEPHSSRKRYPVRVGRMTGGWCEASPATLESAIREARDEAPLGLRTGSLAIPIAAYRNSFENRLEPEKCHEDALRGTAEVLGEALRLCHRWPFGLRGQPAAVDQPGAPDVVQTLLNWHDRFKLLSSVTDDWVCSRRKGLIT
jgi:hypothetical protein